MVQTNADNLLVGQLEKRRGEEKMNSQSPSSSFWLCLKLSSERFEKERDELLPILEQSKEGSESEKEKEYNNDDDDQLPRKKNNKNKNKTTMTKIQKKKKKKIMRRQKKEKAIQVVAAEPVPSPFLDLNEEPNNRWSELDPTDRPVFIFDRKLTYSDVKRDQSRCFLNYTEMMEVLVPALTEEEHDHLYDKEKKLKMMVVNERLEEYEMELVRWPSIEQFALIKGWTKFVNDNALREDDHIRVSYFRYGDERKLGLIIDCTRRRPEVVVEMKEETVGDTSVTHSSSSSS